MSSSSHPKSMTSELLAFGWDEKEARSHWTQFSKFGNASATEMTGKVLSIAIVADPVYETVNKILYRI